MVVCVCVCVCVCVFACVSVWVCMYLHISYTYMCIFRCFPITKWLNNGGLSPHWLELLWYMAKTLQIKYRAALKLNTRVRLINAILGIVKRAARTALNWGHWDFPLHLPCWVAHYIVHNNLCQPVMDCIFIGYPMTFTNSSFNSSTAFPLFGECTWSFCYGPDIMQRALHVSFHLITQ